MTGQADIEVVQRFYRAVPSGSVEELTEILDPEVRWHVPGRHPRSGTYAGRATALGLLAHPASSSFELVDIAAGGQFVMALIAHQRRSADGREVTGRFVHVVMVRAGRIAESWHFDEDQTELDRILRSGPSGSPSTG